MSRANKAQQSTYSYSKMVIVKQILSTDNGIAFKHKLLTTT